MSQTHFHPSQTLCHWSAAVTGGIAYASQYILYLYLLHSKFFHSEMQLSADKPPNYYPPHPSTKKIKHYIFNFADIIGKGNFARVYKGLNTNTQQSVAIKVVSLDELKSNHLEALVYEEIKILQQMNHPNVLRFTQALFSQRNCYIVTELCNGGNLQERIQTRRPFSQSELSKIIADLYQGLRYLREMGVCHRDIKPANIFFNNGKAKIADFGLAKFYQQRFKDLDIGSPPYMSPQGLIHHYYGEKTDVWAFGILLYEMLHGESPFCRCTSEEDLKNSVTKPIPEYKFNQNINPQLRQLIHSLLEVSEIKRPSIFQLQNESYIRGILSSIPIKRGSKKLSITEASLQNGQNSLELHKIANQKCKNLTGIGKYVQPASKSIEANNNQKSVNFKKGDRKIQLSCNNNSNSTKIIELGGSKNIQNGPKAKHIGQESSKTNGPLEPVVKELSQHHYLPPRAEQGNRRVPLSNTGLQFQQPQGMRRQQSNEKTVETKQSEEERGYFLSGRYHFPPHYS